MTTSSGSTTVDAGAQGVRFPLVLGLDTFGDVTSDPAGRPLSHAQTIRNLVEEGVLAEQVGADFFGIGEHHTDDFPLSAGGRRARRDRRAHKQDPPWIGRYGLELG